MTAQGDREPWTVLLAEHVLRAIFNEAAAGGCELETGGILLGHDDEANGTTRVTAAGAPGRGAVREPGFFLRDLDFARMLAEEAWKHDRSQWVGEWHTHPWGRPVPSELDFRSYDAHVHDPELAFRRFISLILAWDVAGQWTLGVWVVDSAGVNGAKLQIAESDAAAQ